VLLEIGAQSDALLGAFVHKTIRGQAAGGVRHWRYTSVADMVVDGLRLARGMGRKNSLAGLWWGGGKGIIARPADRDPRDADYRAAVYADYGRFVSSLRGLYVTAEDVGTTAADMAQVHTTTRFVTCVPPEIGGSGNPSSATARGVVCAMQGALAWMNQGSLEGKHVAMQGTGNVAGFMAGYLLEAGVARITAVDISEASVAALTQRWPDPRLQARCVAPSDLSIFATDCDVLAPNALGGVLNPETIPLLRAKLVCGAANNQLLDDTRDAMALRERGIPVVPDFVANRMGIVQCANEQYGCLPDDPAILRHFDSNWDDSVFAVTQAVLKRASDDGITTAAAANALADEASLQPHPLWPNRGKDIVTALLAERWADQ